jgi:hypothetical protein
MALQPRLGARDQGRGDLGVGRLEHPPLAGAGADMVEYQSVDLGGDPPDRRPVALGQEKGRLGVLEPGVGARIEQAVHFRLERRHPVRIVAVQRPLHVDERLDVGGLLDGADGDGGRAHGPAW